MSKARILADLISDSQITASEITGLELNAIQEGDTIVEVSDDGSGGKVVVRVDGADNAEFNAGGLKIPSGTTAQRDPNAALGSLRFNTTVGFFETLTGSGWGVVATPPSITGITPDNFNGEAGSTFTIDGAFFDADTTAVFKGADGTEYSAATVTFVNNSQITVTNAANLPVANEPYKVKVINGAGLSVESISTIDAGTVPAFTTAAGSLASTSRWDEAVSVTVQASDAESSIASYSITEGNLPAGLSLNSTTGAITGTSTEQATTTYTFTVQATDTAGNTNTRQFSIQIVNQPPVWNSPAEGSTTTFDGGQNNTLTLDAVDPEGSPVSYSLTSGTLPTGISLSGNTISGEPSVDQQSSSLTLSASDGYLSSTRSFFINTSVFGNISPTVGFLNRSVPYFAQTQSTMGYATNTTFEYTNRMCWQPFYAHKDISFNQLAIATDQSGGNSWTWYLTQSANLAYGYSAPASLGGFNESYTAYWHEPDTIQPQTIPAETFFMIGILGGPYYKTFQSLNSGRVYNKAIEVINHCYATPHSYSDELPHIPSALGGTDSASGAFQKLQDTSMVMKIGITYEGP